MSSIGKSIRLERIIDRESGKTLIVPMDHGVTIGPVEGLFDMGKTVDSVAKGGANAVLGHIGLPLHGHRGYGPDVGLILHLSASTQHSPDANNKVLVNNITHAMKLGADAVSIHVNIGAVNEADMLRDLGRVSVECMEWGLPLLAMMYPRGPSIKNGNDPEAVSLAVRVAAELGVDIIKTNYTGDPDSFKKVIKGSLGVPVIVAGGSKADSDLEFLKSIEGAMRAGASGVATGRNVFQHNDPEKMVRAIADIVHKGKTAEEAIQ